ncbi:MAG: 30S ribosomal protein S2 [Bacteroidales bacterium]|nr:30S ribosomal protein S2 [Bacteroidales bacterium]
MPETSFKELLDAGVHFGHLKRKWNPAMSPYIFMEKNGIHIIDLNKTEAKLSEAASAMKQIAKSGRKILFVATKKQAKDIVSEKVKEINMPYVTERWPGGMLTNFPTIRKAVKKMGAIDKMSVDGTFDNLSKRERLQITRQRAKLEKNLGSIADLTRLPAAMFVVDVVKEYIAVREANRLNIPVFAMVDTNSDPRNIDFPIPSNDDASKSISLIINYVGDAVAEGLSERKMEKEKEAAESKAKKSKADSQKSEAATKGSEAKAEEQPEAKAGERREAGSRKRTDSGRRSESRKVESEKVETKEVKAEVKEEKKAEKKKEKKEEKAETKEEKKAEKKEEKTETKEEKTDKTGA